MLGGWNKAWLCMCSILSCCWQVGPGGIGNLHVSGHPQGQVQLHRWCETDMDPPVSSCSVLSVPSWSSWATYLWAASWDAPTAPDPPSDCGRDSSFPGGSGLQYCISYNKICNANPHLVCKQLLRSTTLNFNAVKWKSLRPVQLFAITWTVARQVPLSMEFSMLKY